VAVEEKFKRHQLFPTVRPQTNQVLQNIPNGRFLALCHLFLSSGARVLADDKKDKDPRTTFRIQYLLEK